MFKVASWNIRGLNDPLEQKDIRNFDLENKISILCMVESKVRFSNISGVFGKCCPGCKVIHSCDQRNIGRIWVCNDDKVFDDQPISITAK